MRILILNGPNINLLGEREPDIYGSDTYNDLKVLIKDYANKNSIHTDFYQSNHEGDLIDQLQVANNVYDGIVFNAAAYTHTSIALFDTLKAITVPCVEVHITDVDNREHFRKTNYIRPACIGSISNEGINGYISAIKLLEKRKKWFFQ